MLGIQIFREETDDFLCSFDARLSRCSMPQVVFMRPIDRHGFVDVTDPPRLGKQRKERIVAESEGAEPWRKCGDGIRAEHHGTGLDEITGR